MSKTTPKLSLLIPVFNEEATLTSVLNRLKGIAWPVPLEFVLIDDRSTDGSYDLLQKWIAEEKASLEQKGIQLNLSQQPINQGKGSAIHAAIELATGEVLIVQDADEEYVPEEIMALVAPILEGKADVVFGSRFKKSALQAHRTYHYLVNRFLTILSNLCSGLYVTDMETCYKAFRADVIKGIRLRSKRFGFEPEITAHIARLKVRVWELPISYYPRTYLQGKKITWRDGIAALWHILYFNWILPMEDRYLPSLPDKYLPPPKVGKPPRKELPSFT